MIGETGSHLICCRTSFAPLTPGRFQPTAPPQLKSRRINPIETFPPQGLPALRGHLQGESTSVPFDCGDFGAFRRLHRLCFAARTRRESPGPFQELVEVDPDHSIRSIRWNAIIDRTERRDGKTGTGTTRADKTGKKTRTGATRTAAIGPRNPLCCPTPLTTRRSRSSTHTRTGTSQAGRAPAPSLLAHTAHDVTFATVSPFPSRGSGSGKGPTASSCQPMSWAPAVGCLLPWKCLQLQPFPCTEPQPANRVPQRDSECFRFSVPQRTAFGRRPCPEGRGTCKRDFGRMPRPLPHCRNCSPCGGPVPISVGPPGRTIWCPINCRKRPGGSLRGACYRVVVVVPPAATWSRRPSSPPLGGGCGDSPRSRPRPSPDICPVLALVHRRHEDRHRPKAPDAEQGQERSQAKPQAQLAPVGWRSGFGGGGLSARDWKRRVDLPSNRCWRGSLVAIALL